MFSSVGGKASILPLTSPLLYTFLPRTPCMQDFGMKPMTFLPLTLCHLSDHHWEPLIPLSLPLSCVHSFSPLIRFCPYQSPSEQFPTLS